MAEKTPAVDWEILADVPPLPSKDDKLFTTAEDWWNNACLNYSHNGWTLYALGYKNAADLLVLHVEDGRRSQNTLVYQFCSRIDSISNSP